MIKKLSGKLAFLLAVVMATMVGGITTAVVMAAIPDSSGQITACRRNGTGAARIIDTASQSCNFLESSVSWSQGGGSEVKAYGYIEFDPETRITPSLRTGYSEHIVNNIYRSTINSTALCVEFDATVTNPKQIIVSSTDKPETPAANLSALSPGFEYLCSATTDAIVYDYTNGSGIFVRVY